MNLLDQLIRQSDNLIEIIDELINSIKKVQDKIVIPNENEMFVLHENITRTVNLTKSFMDVYNEFLKDHTKIELEK